MSHPVAVLAIADPSLRQRLGRTLAGLRWDVVETAGGAEALAELEKADSQAVILDRWLPDLDVQEFFREVQSSFPGVDLISVDGSLQSPAPRNGRHGELMHAIRVSQEWDGAAHLLAREIVDDLPGRGAAQPRSMAPRPFQNQPVPTTPRKMPAVDPTDATKLLEERVASRSYGTAGNLPEFLGSNPAILEVGRRIRLVASRNTSVLVQGPSGTGKELVARAIHRLSPRSNRPFVVLNCAAIPESLLEAELFGHTRGAFTGAVQGRVGRIEAAHGGTLFLDEIGEMPLALQSKLLRFLEAGEIQRVGENETLTVDVRVVAATHQLLAQRVRQGTFREDVFYRLAVFLIRTPALSEHVSDVPMYAASFLRRLCETSPAKKLEAAALDRLLGHSWPGNVRELAHVIERAYILAENRLEICREDIEFDSLE